MRIPALTVLAFVASGCTIHVVEEPRTPLAQQPVPVLVAAPTLAPVVAAAAPSPPPASADPALREPPHSAAQLPTSPLRNRPRPELVAHAEPARPLRFKDTRPEPRTTEMASVATPTPARIEKHRRFDKDRASLADVAQAQ